MKIMTIVGLTLGIAGAIFVIARRSSDAPAAAAVTLDQSKNLHPKSGGELVPLPGGGFSMGSAAGRAGRNAARRFRFAFRDGYESRHAGIL